MDTPKAGTRLKCSECGTEVMVVKAPTGPLSCCGKQLGGRDEEKAANG
jgi:hypothetical protein